MNRQHRFRFLIGALMGVALVAGSAASVPTAAASTDPIVVDGTATTPTVRVTAGDGSISVTWDEIPGVTLYQFRYNAGGGWQWDAPAESLTRDVSGLVNGVGVTVEVRALVDRVWRGWTSVTVTPTVAVVEPPEPPVDEPPPPPPPPSSGDGSQPNVVVIMVDDMPKHSMWVLDDTIALLGDHGTTYTNAVVQHALCCPSRATLLTGQFSHNHGVVTNIGGYSKYKATPRFRDNIGHWLQGAGYRTALTGKFLNGYGAGIPPGFDRWAGLIGATAYNYENYKINVDGQIEWHQMNKGGPYQTDRLAELAVDQIVDLAASGEPFFQWITPLAPHTQGGKNYAIPAPEYDGAHAGETYRPPHWSSAGAMTRPKMQRFGALTNTEVAQVDASYEAMLESLESVDDLVVDVVAALDAAGVLDNTLVMFTSDHGYFNGQFGLPVGKIHPYEPALLVPLYIRGPGFAAGAVDDRLTVNADVPATILAAAGATPGVPLDGVPLSALFEGRAVPLFGIAGTRTYRGVRTDSEVWWTINGKEAEQYDLAADPWQLQNLTTGPRWRLDSTRDAMLADLGACAGAGCVAVWP